MQSIGVRVESAESLNLSKELSTECVLFDSFEYSAVLHNEGYPSQHLNVVKRILRRCDNVGSEADLDCATLLIYGLTAVRHSLS